MEVKGVTYVWATEVRRELGIARQTLWRWRRQGKIPAGYRYRNGRVLFTQNRHPNGGKRVKSNPKEPTTTG